MGGSVGPDRRRIVGASSHSAVDGSSSSQDSTRRSITARSSSSVTTKRKTMKRTKCGETSSFVFFICPTSKSGLNLSRLKVYHQSFPFRTEWERENQRDCHSSLSSGEASYPHEGPEEGYSYHPLHPEPSRKNNTRYPSTDSPVNTRFTNFPA